jgi:hypothetical protein
MAQRARDAAGHHRRHRPPRPTVGRLPMSSRGASPVKPAPMEERVFAPMSEEEMAW